ncbi:MAG TPA: hypothetical protein VMI30_13485 [Stellaceae bacterium]|nr:hypothetical protein [Stellaceae bacterium]
MGIYKFLAAAAVCAGVAMAGTAHAAIAVWPADVPCSSITVNADGSYTLTTDVALVNGQIFASGTTFPTGGEYDVWARCKS